MTKRPACISENVPLSGLTTFRIGGPARWFAEPARSGELDDVLEFASANRLKMLVLGGGSNLLAADAGVDALVIRLKDGGDFSGVSMDRGDPLVWTVGAAVALPALVASTLREGICGLEALAGIPGRVGGAAAMNAGGAEIGLGRYVVEAEVRGIDGPRRLAGADQLRFAYRDSALKGLLATRLVLRFDKRGDAGELSRLAADYKAKKAATQPLDMPSPGCFFKNPPGDSAGRLLDAAGCKGMREGGAAVSGTHANFIVNQGGATAGQVAALALRMRDAVEKASNHALRPEATLWGDEPGFAALSE